MCTPMPPHLVIAFTFSITSTGLCRRSVSYICALLRKPKKAVDNPPSPRQLSIMMTLSATWKCGHCAYGQFVALEYNARTLFYSSRLNYCSTLRIYWFGSYVEDYFARAHTAKRNSRSNGSGVSIYGRPLRVKASAATTPHIAITNVSFGTPYATQVQK